MRDLYEGLRTLNVADERIRFKAFGPASVKRTSNAVRNDSPVATEPTPGSVPVTFARSQRTVRWLPKDGSLLEFAEACGIDAPSSCRSGMCGTCSTRVLNGNVSYQDAMDDAEIEPGSRAYLRGPSGSEPNRGSDGGITARNHARSLNARR